MMIRLRKFAAVLLALLMMLSMTGCEELDYREAVQFYNAHRYEEASQLLSQLGDYKESADLLKRCAYWTAVDTMVAEDYASALEQFQALGDLEDSAARVTECTYQLAMAAYEAEDFSLAENYFLQFPEYKQTPECIRQINWRKFFAQLQEKGELTLEQDGRIFSVTAEAETETVRLHVSMTRDLGYVFYDDLTVTFTRENMQAAFTGTSTFTMTLNGKEIGSSQKSSGTLDIPTCNAQTALVVDAFQKDVQDNLGASSSTESPAESTMYPVMAENYAALMQLLPQLLADNGVEIPLTQIGFSAM